MASYDDWKQTEPEEWHGRGIERTCTDCGETVLVSRDEDYVLHVFCDRCIAKSAASQDAGTHKTEAA